MSKDLNKCSFIGRLGKDPEVRFFPEGGAVANVSLACGDDYKKRDTGEKVEKTNWIPLVFRNRQAELVGEYLKKGSLIYVEGKFTTRKWQDNTGQDRYSTEIIAEQMQMLGSRGDSQSYAPGQQSAPQAATYDDFDPEEIPF